MAKLLGKRSEAFIRAEIMDQGRAIHGVSKEDNDITREVLNIKYFTAQAVATVESATQSQGKKVLKKLKKDVFRLARAWEKKKLLVPMSNRTSDFRIPRSDAIPLSHRESTVSEVYYEVHMTRVLHTARISNVDRLMFVDRN